MQCLDCILQNEMQKFVIDDNSNNIKIGIFLPPKYVILLQFEVSSTETLVRLRLDNWELLGLVEDYLESFC